MEEFRKGATRVLITTDVWARGLDVQQVLRPPSQHAALYIFMILGR